MSLLYWNKRRLGYLVFEWKIQELWTQELSIRGNYRTFNKKRRGNDVRDPSLAHLTAPRTCSGLRVMTKRHAGFSVAFID
jgi:hypothetical protein